MPYQRGISEAQTTLLGVLLFRGCSDSRPPELEASLRTADPQNGSALQELGALVLGGDHLLSRSLAIRRGSRRWNGKFFPSTAYINHLVIYQSGT